MFYTNFEGCFHFKVNYTFTLPDGREFSVETTDDVFRDLINRVEQFALNSFSLFYFLKTGPGRSIFPRAVNFSEGEFQECLNAQHFYDPQNNSVSFVGRYLPADLSYNCCGSEEFYNIATAVCSSRRLDE